MKVLIGLIIVAAFIALLPILILWSLNTLFDIGIQYGLKEWLAAVVLLAVFAPKKPSSRHQRQP